MKVGQTGDLMCHGTGTLLTMDLTGILWVSKQSHKILLSLAIWQRPCGAGVGLRKGGIVRRQ